MTATVPATRTKTNTPHMSSPKLPVRVVAVTVPRSASVDTAVDADLSLPLKRF
jgi:hypothetical protein